MVGLVLLAWTLEGLYLWHMIMGGLRPTSARIIRMVRVFFSVSVFRSARSFHGRSSRMRRHTAGSGDFA